jgi:hypothetical protein
MTINANAMLHEQAKIVYGLGAQTPSTSTSDFVSLKGYERCHVLIQALNGSTVTGSAITLGQAVDVANTSGKALAFSTQYANTDCAATDTLVETAVTSNTFTTSTTNSKQLMHIIDIKPTDLDVAGGFDCVCVKAATAVNTTLSITFYLYPARFAKATPTSAILD